MSKNEFVLYEEALALKELGFDETCFKSYQRGKYRPCVSSDLELMDVAYDDFIDLCHAPLYQQSFRWFREKYSWNSWVDQGFTESFRYNICESNGSIIGVEGFSTYEDAELACLRKLIEIVKI